MTHSRQPLLQILRGPHELPAPPEPRRTAASARDAVERCDFCASELPEAHGHLVHLGRRALLCVCRACGLLFTQPGAARGLFRAVPDRYLALAAGAADTGWWPALQVPVTVACFIVSTDGSVRAFYPGPAGATEAGVPDEGWEQTVGRYPVLRTLAPEVEALLVRAGNGGLDAFIVPVDACYELAGRIRLRWRGFSGGDEVREAIDRFFAHVAARAAGKA